MSSLFLLSRVHLTRLFLCSLCVVLGSQSAQAADSRAPSPPTQAEQVELEKFDSYSGPINVLDPNPKREIHKFLDKNEGKTVYLDATIVRYIPIDPLYIDDPNIRASTDRFDNPIFTKCWPDQKADYEGMLNFGAEGFPLPADEKDIEAGCASRIRFDLPNIRDAASIPTLWGDNKLQVFVTGFFSVSKTTLGGGQTLYTLKLEGEVPHETRLAFDKHKTKEHPQAWLSYEKQK